MEGSTTIHATKQNIEADSGYAELEKMIRERISFYVSPLFTTELCTPENRHLLWEAYLNNIPEASRQHYNCHSCKEFIERYGGLVVISTTGEARSFLWAINAPAFFLNSISELYRIVNKSKVTGVFKSSTKKWGQAETPDKKRPGLTWTHLSGESSACYHKTVLQDADQKMAEHKQEYIMLVEALKDYPLDVVKDAHRILQADAVYRSEKALAVAEWFKGVHESVADVKNNQARRNLLWVAVALAPPGFCHVRSTVISTLMDDIKSGFEIEVIKKRWADKLHPLQYQRPSAAPSEGAISRAEEIFEKLGAASALRRRYATLDDVQKLIWVPVPPEAAGPPSADGVFGHLREKKPGVTPIELPAQNITWDKFQRTVLPNAVKMDIYCPAQGPYYGMHTASDPEAAAIIQWDGLAGHPRNPVSWYFWSHGGTAGQYNLIPFNYCPVSAIFLPPHQWQEPDKFKHHHDMVMFSIKGATEVAAASLCLFPEILKSEFREIRSVVERHGASARIENPELGTANGLAFQKDGAHLKLRVTDKDGGVANYILDRWD